MAYCEREMWSEDECGLGLLSDAELDLLVDDTSISTYLSGEVTESTNSLTVHNQGKCDAEVISQQQDSPGSMDVIIVDDDVAEIQHNSRLRPVLYVKRPVTAQSTAHSHGHREECKTKNAIAARENRMKKKKYVAELETSVSELTQENSRLKKNDEEKTQIIAKLTKEVEYLKNVIANQSVLSSLLQNINSIPGIKLGTSLTSCPNENDERPSATAQKRNWPLQGFVSTRARAKLGDTSTPLAKRQCGYQSRIVPGNKTTHGAQVQSFASKMLNKAETIVASKNSAETVSEMCSLGEETGDKGAVSGRPSSLKGGVCLHVSARFLR